VCGYFFSTNFCFEKQKFQETMDNLDHLSDEELRHRLLQYGFPNLPVTETTRKTLIKKLRNQLENEKSKLKRQTTYATRYSSGEESDDTDGRRSSNHRTTIKVSMPPPPVNRSKRNTVAAPRMTYVTAVHKDTATNSTDKYPIQPRSSVYVSPVLVNESDEEADGGRATSSTTGPTSFERYTPNYKTLRLLPTIGGTTAPLNYSSSYLRNRYTSNRRDDEASVNGSSSGDDSPVVSDLTKRLLKFRGEAVKDSANQRNNKFLTSRRYTTPTSPLSSTGNGPIDENDIVCHAEPSPDPPTVPLNVALTNLINKLDEYYGVRQTFVPCLLVTALILFFVFVGFMYMTISPDIVSTLNEVDTTYKLCTADQSQPTASLGFGEQPTIDCIEKSDLQPALDALKSLMAELQRRVEHNKCVDRDFPYIMTTKEIIHHYIEANPDLHVMQTMRNIHNIEYLVEKNPQWRIRNVDGTGNEIGMREIIEMRPAEVNALAILNPRLPFTCLLYKKLQTFFLIVGGIALLSICGYLLNLFVKFIVYVKQSRREQINSLVNAITSTVMEQVSGILNILWL
jgi:inner nuclear membrane protein Man1